MCSVTVVDEWGRTAASPPIRCPERTSRQAWSAQRRRPRRAEAVEAAAIAAAAGDQENNPGNGNGQFEEEEQADVFVRSASELAELHIERLGLVAVGGGADGVISMDFSEDSRFLRFAISHVVAESIEGATAQPETSGDAGAVLLQKRRRRRRTTEKRRLL